MPPPQCYQSSKWTAEWAGRRYWLPVGLTSPCSCNSFFFFLSMADLAACSATLIKHTCWLRLLPRTYACDLRHAPTVYSRRCRLKYNPKTLYSTHARRLTSRKFLVAFVPISTTGVPVAWVVCLAVLFLDIPRQCLRRDCWNLTMM